MFNGSEDLSYYAAKVNAGGTPVYTALPNIASTTFMVYGFIVVSSKMKLSNGEYSEI